MTALARSLAVALTTAIGGVPVAASAAQAPGADKGRPKIEVAFVLDTTGSMSNLIAGAKRKIWSIASKIATGRPTPELRVGLVGYRDRGDAYLTQRFDLTDDLDAMYEHLQAFRADGGGDTPEHVGQALGEAVKHFSWSQDKRTLKMIFVVGDAPPQTYGDGWNYKEWAKRAIHRGIMVNTIRCGSSDATGVAFREIANLADGQFISVDGSGGMNAVSTPYDADIARVTTELAGTAVYVGKERARRKATAAVRALEAMDDEAAADRAGYLSKKAAVSGRGVSAAPKTSGAKDLVAGEPAAVAGVPRSQLPREFKGLSKAARVAKVKALKVKRAKLERELAELTHKRDAHIAKHAAEREDSFDGAVMKEVRARASKIGVSYE